MSSLSDPVILESNDVTLFYSYSSMLMRWHEKWTKNKGHFMANMLSPVPSSSHESIDQYFVLRTEVMYFFCTIFC